MLELQLTDNSGDDAPILTFIEAAWLLAEPPEVREYNFYLFNDYLYTPPPSATETDFAAVDLLNATISFIPLDNNAQAFLDDGCLQVRADTLKAAVPYSAENSFMRFTYDDVTRTDYTDWQIPVNPILIGDIPRGRPLDGSVVDSNKALRLDIRIMNPNNDMVGWARFAINVNTANESSAEGSIPVYDTVLLDTIVCGFVPPVNRNRANLHADILLEVFVLDKDTQQAYTEAGFVFEEV